MKPGGDGGGPVPGKVQAEVLAAGVFAIGAAVLLRNATRAMSAHSGKLQAELLVIGRDVLAAVLALAAVAIALLAARSVSRREGRHHAPPVPQPPRPAYVQRPGEPAHGGYRLRPPSEAPRQVPLDDLLPGGRP